MTEETRRYLHKSQHALEVAKDLLEHGHAADAASKIYYAMFYAAQALLKNSDIQATKHSAVESSLGYHFVKQGKLDPKFHKAFIGARRVREMADYDITAEADALASTVTVQDAEEFIAAIKKTIDNIERSKTP